MDKDKQVKTAEAKPAEIGGSASEWVMTKFDQTFGKMFASEKDRQRFRAGVAAELLRNPDLREKLKTNLMVRYGFQVALATCAWDKVIPSVHCFLNLRYIRGNTPVVTREDKLEASLAQLEDNGYVPMRPVLVYKGDEFSFSREIVNGKHTNRLSHKPCGIDDPEKITGGYIILERADGSRTDWEYVPREVFNVKRKNAIGNMSDQQRAHAPWHKHFGEMCQKTVAKRATRYFNKVPLVEVLDSHVNEAAATIISDETLTDEQRAVLQEQYDRSAYAEDDGMPPPEVVEGNVVTDAEVIEPEPEEKPKAAKRGRPKKEQPEAEPKPEPEEKPTGDEEDFLVPDMPKAKPAEADAPDGGNGLDLDD